MMGTESLQSLRASRSEPGTISPEAWNRLIDHIQRCQLVKGAGYGLRQMPGGTQIVFFDLDAKRTVRRLEFFQILDATKRDGDGNVTARKVRVVAGTIDGQLPAGMEATDDPVFTLTVSGDGEVYAQVTFNESTGAVTAHTIAQSASTPESTGTTKTLLIGGFSVPEADDKPIAVNNVAFGPLAVEVCRDWYSYPLTYGFSWRVPG